MTTFAQWRSPGRRPDMASSGSKPRQYDTRVVDQFYTYCQAVSIAEQQRADSARSHETAKRHLWKLLFAGSLICFYVVERVSQTMLY